MEGEKDVFVMDVEKVAEYIQDRLLAEKGIVVEKENIEMILDFEFDYMIENGLAEAMEEE